MWERYVDKDFMMFQQRKEDLLPQTSAIAKRLSEQRKDVGGARLASDNCSSWSFDIFGRFEVWGPYYHGDSYGPIDRLHATCIAMGLPVTDLQWKGQGNYSFYLVFPNRHKHVQRKCLEDLLNIIEAAL